VISAVVVNLIQFLWRNVLNLVLCCLILLTEFVKIQDFSVRFTELQAHFPV
jgi:hypothetical protein